MYIWIGCKLPEDFEREIRARCLALNEAIGLNTVPFSLPQHVSVKISFDAGARTDEIIEYLTCLLSEESQFYVNPISITREENVIWIPIGEQERLSLLHQKLDRKLEQRFGIPQHEFDKHYFFHSTLFIDRDAGKIRQMHEQLRTFPLPTSLPVDTILLGTSPDGRSDSYHVVREIKLRPPEN